MINVFTIHEWKSILNFVQIQYGLSLDYTFSTMNLLLAYCVQV